MTSVGPPAGNPTTTRTGRLGYPSAHDGAAPVISRTAAKTQRRMDIVALSPRTFWFLLGAIIGEDALRNKGALRGRQSCFAQDRMQTPGEVCLTEGLFDDRKLADRIVPFQHVLRIAGGQKDLDVVAHSPRFTGKLDAAYSVRHHDVAE